jgi:hypothetical protein
MCARDDTDAMTATNAAARDDTSSDSEENGPRKRRLHGKPKKTRKEIFDLAVAELEQSGGVTFCMAITSFLLACSANIVGIFTPWDEIDGTYRSFAMMAGVFLINQSFMFVKTVRDGEITSMKDHHGRTSPEYHFLQGGLPGDVAPHRAVCFGCLMASIVAEAYGICVMDAKRHTQMFIGLSSLYVLSSSLNLGWILRDRFEAEVWKEEKVDRFIGSNKVELAVRNMVKVLGNMQQAMKLMFMFIGAAAIAITTYAIIDFGVKEKGVGLLISAMVFSCASAWSMAQALNEEALQDKAHRMHQCATMVFFGLAVSLTVSGLVEMEIEWRKRIVLGLGVLIILDATLNFAKVVYRVTKVKKIVKKIKKGFNLDIDLEDHSKTIFDSALDTFAQTTMDAGRDTNPYAGAYVYGDNVGGPPPPPGHDGGYEPMYR